MTAVRGETVNRTSGEIVRVIDSSQIRDAALSGRNYLEFASLISGAVQLNDDQMGVTTGLGTGSYEILKRLFASRDPELDSPYVFCHAQDTMHAGKPVLDVKNAFHAVLLTAKIDDFTWHDFRHDSPLGWSWLV